MMSKKSKQFTLVAIILATLPSMFISQSCIKYRCADLTENDITDAADSIPLCVYETEINPTQILIDSTICVKSKPLIGLKPSLTLLEFPLLQTTCKPLPDTTLSSCQPSPLKPEAVLPGEYCD
jgi:hypothetical protein